MPQRKFSIVLGILLTGMLLPLSHASAGTILSAHKYAWGDHSGYINFAQVTVTDTALAGHAWSANHGWIKFNPALGGVLNDGTGNLSGSAWGEQLGWIDFDGVNIDDGVFSGTATGSAGTITFDCNFCDVETDWRPTSSPGPSSAGGASGGGNAAPSGNTTPPTSPANLSAPLFPATGPIGPSGDISPDTVGAKGGAVGGSGQLLLEHPPLFDVLAEPRAARVDTSSAGLVTRVAPGEFLPISVTLSNFGEGNSERNRVDVSITYSIVSETGEELYASSETVAVETTASFVKTIQIPFDAPPGRYTARTSITYEGQLVPAGAEFSFAVERKILGVFQSDFVRYGGLALLFSIGMFLLGRTWITHRRAGRLVPLEYADIPNDQRVFYELVSDTVMAMRQRVGDRALAIAGSIEGLSIDAKTGRVLKLEGSPSKVVAELVSGYEKTLGEKVSFSFRNTS